jgi:transcriptional regulator GlxA family with amidase domain
MNNNPMSLVLNIMCGDYFTNKLTLKMYRSLLIALILTSVYQCKSPSALVDVPGPNHTIDPSNYNVGFLVMNGVYNTELTAPFDIFQHTKYREGIKAMNTFLIAKKLEPVTSFEGIRMFPDYAYENGNYPPIDILVVPSAEHHLDYDLEDVEMINFVRQTAKNALYVTSHCDGAFVLAKAGLLNDVASTTFPSDIDTYKKMFPQLEVISDVIFVHDQKYITSAGGAKSFEASLYLAEVLYGPEIARRLAKGLVIDWDLEGVQHLVVDSSK